MKKILSNRKKIYNLLSSLFSLGLTITLLITTAYGWYAANKEVRASSIIASSAGDDYTLVLERWIYNSNLGSGAWSETNDLSIRNVSPGNTFFFRLNIDKDESLQNLDLVANFGGVQSQLDDKLCVNNSYVCVNGTTPTPLYPIANNSVIISAKMQYEFVDGDISQIASPTSTNYTLYSFSNNTISLSQCKIEDAFVFYDLGGSDTNITSGFTNRISSVPNTLSTDTKHLLIDATCEFNSNTKYRYFALEFNENLSLAEIDGLISSNLYMYQKLLIDNITIKVA